MKIGLVGNQNSGKTTLFNCLTGMNAKIGNWPGVTIEKKVGNIKETSHELIDLPGIYSLSPYSTEEEVARDFILNVKPDMIINIIDATCIERSLYLTTQLLELDCKIIVVLNMADILEQKGFKIDVKKLEERLGTRVIKISALKETGINELIQEIELQRKTYKIQVFDSCLENAVNDVIKEIENNKDRLVHKKFIAIKLLEKDIKFRKYETKNIKKIIEWLNKKYDTDLEETIATQRYKFIENIKRECVIKKLVPESKSDKLDKILLNKWLAFPIFIAIMFLVYYLSVGIVGSYTVDLIGELISNFSNDVENFLFNIGTSKWLNSLIVDGIISGVGAILSFVPQLVILFLCISLLETTGYMSRIALLLDKVFRKIGLSGKSLIPFIVGSGCSVPGIMGTRIIENDDERKMTVILTPFIPCSAKLPIIALFSGYFFSKNSGLVSSSLYFLAIFIIVLSAIIMKKTTFKNTPSTYISEFPEYKVPNIKYVAKDVWDKVIAFIKRAGTVILLCSIIIWFLLSFSVKLENVENVENSILANIGNKISWIFNPILGTNSWEATVSAIQGLVAKEQVVSSMSVINGLANGAEEGSKIFSNTGAFGFFSKSSAYAFLVFNLFSAPCFGAIGAMKKELGSFKKLFKAIAFQTGLAWILSTIVYQLGYRIENNSINIVNVILITLIIIIVIAIMKCVIKNSKDNCKMCPYCDTCNR